MKSGKEVEAVYFASESGLSERYPPLSLLKLSLRNCRKNANNISKKGKFSSAAVVRIFLCPAPDFSFTAVVCLFSFLFKKKKIPDDSDIQ